MHKELCVVVLVKEYFLSPLNGPIMLPRKEAKNQKLRDNRLQDPQLKHPSSINLKRNLNLKGITTQPLRGYGQAGDINVT